LKTEGHFLPKYEAIHKENFSISWTWNEADCALKK